MADTKISALTEKVTSNAADYLVIVDSVTAENRKVKRENILRADGEHLVLLATSGSNIILNNNANGGAVVISDNLKTNLITEKTAAAGVTIAGTGGLIVGANTILTEGQIQSVGSNFIVLVQGAGVFDLRDGASTAKYSINGNLGVSGSADNTNVLTIEGGIITAIN